MKRKKSRRLETSSARMSQTIGKVKTRPIAASIHDVFFLVIFKRSGACVNQAIKPSTLSFCVVTVRRDIVNMTATIPTDFGRQT